MSWGEAERDRIDFNFYLLEVRYADQIVELACCTNGSEALQAGRRHRSDILILDLLMPGKDSFTVRRGLQKGRLPSKAVVLAADLDEDEVLKVIHLSMRGVVLKAMVARNGSEAYARSIAVATGWRKIPLHAPWKRFLKAGG